jgi:hypothetical protein
MQLVRQGHRVLLRLVRGVDDGFTAREIVEARVRDAEEAFALLMGRGQFRYYCFRMESGRIGGAY